MNRVLHLFQAHLHIYRHVYHYANQPETSLKQFYSFISVFV
jgi:hypothetical protein